MDIPNYIQNAFCFSHVVFSRFFPCLLALTRLRIPALTKSHWSRPRLFLGKGVATAIFDPQPHQPIDSTASCHCPLRIKRYIVHTPKQLAGNSNANASMGITSALKNLLPRSNSNIDFKQKLFQQCVIANALQFLVTTCNVMNAHGRSASFVTRCFLCLIPSCNGGLWSSRFSSSAGCPQSTSHITIPYQPWAVPMPPTPRPTHHHRTISLSNRRENRQMEPTQEWFLTISIVQEHFWLEPRLVQS